MALVRRKEVIRRTLGVDGLLQIRDLGRVLELDAALDDLAAAPGHDGDLHVLPASPA